MNQNRFRYSIFFICLSVLCITGCQTGRHIAVRTEMDTANQLLRQPDDYEIWEDAPDEFQRKHYEAKAQEAKDYVIEQVKLFREIEEKRGRVTERGPNGEKVSVDITNTKGKVIGKLVYIGDDWIYQYCEWKNRKMHGITAFLLKDGTPFRIMRYNNNKFDGPVYEFEEKGDAKGTLVHYIEFKNHAYQGLRLGWTTDGKPIKGCKRINEPIAINFPFF